MKRSTHKAIARAAACAVHLKGGAFEALLRGSVDPDLNPDEEPHFKLGRGGRFYVAKKNVKHHTVLNRERVIKLLWSARKCFLNGRRVEACFLLGRAIHYAQDMCVGAVNHDTTEAELEVMPIPTSYINEAVKMCRQSPAFIERILMKLEPATGEEAIVNASLASAYMVAATLCPPNPPPELLSQFEARKGLHRLLLLFEAISVAVAIAVAAVMPFASMALFVSATAAYAVDGPYRALNKELKWFV